MYDAKTARNKLYDEILQYAHSKQAEGLKAKFMPPPPADEPDADEDCGPSDGDFDDESLKRLRHMVEE